MTTFNAANAAYSNAARLMSEVARPAAQTVAMPGQDGEFAKVLAEAVQGIIDTGRAADQKALDLVNGKGDIVDVVTAISQTEIAMETMVTVRDRVISAYEEIMRMPIEAIEVPFRPGDRGVAPAPAAARQHCRPTHGPANLACSASESRQRGTDEVAGMRHE